MKTRFAFLALLFGLMAAAMSFAAEPATLTPELTAAVEKAAKAGDMQALADLVVNNPGLSVLMTKVAAAANPGKAGVIAATIAKNDSANAPAIAVAAATASGVQPAQAGEIAASVFTVLKDPDNRRAALDLSCAIASAVAQAVPSQIGAIGALLDNAGALDAANYFVRRQNYDKFSQAVAQATHTSASDVLQAMESFSGWSASDQVRANSENAAIGNLSNPIEPGLHMSNDT
jgi:hypothetical protein